MSPARYALAAVPFVAVLMWASLAPAPLAQPEAGDITQEECDRQRQGNEEPDPRCIEINPGHLCRVHWEEQTYGGDTLATTAVFHLQTAAPQSDGSVVFMGQGPADIVFTPGGGCRATRGGTARVTMMAIVTGDNGEATVDIAAFMEDTFPVAVSCPYPHSSEMEVGVSAPPTVTMPLRDRASASYDESSRHSFGRVGGQRGTVTLEYCRPGQNRPR